jgi:hypothetical protein
MQIGDDSSAQPEDELATRSEVGRRKPRRIQHPTQVGGWSPKQPEDRWTRRAGS